MKKVFIIISTIILMLFSSCTNLYLAETTKNQSIVIENQTKMIESLLIFLILALFIIIFLIVSLKIIKGEKSNEIQKNSTNEKEIYKKNN
ncbi:hypothetical protein OSSY52_19160 [Tepiditoga spiralis]|uniref:Lipoprotein n=1 Tax=Tepiditoga spiralis TaxID=2108365 RepID=A0A7G1G6H9_9BACT|nr:hypothetical protein [Tepiditoga spiralis]BBE31775.1 hypothetical protein OSSY52_19160 [Tepiditoga spiralis]